MTILNSNVQCTYLNKQKKNSFIKFCKKLKVDLLNNCMKLINVQLGTHNGENKKHGNVKAVKKHSNILVVGSTLMGHCTLNPNRVRFTKAMQKMQVTVV